MRDRLIRNLQIAFAIGCFEGMGSLKIIMMLIVWEVNQHLSFPLEEVPMFSACDMNQSRQTMLQNFQQPYKCTHIGGNILERFPLDVQQELDKMKPHNANWVEANRLAKD